MEAVHNSYYYLSQDFTSWPKHQWVFIMEVSINDKWPNFQDAVEWRRMSIISNHIQLNSLFSLETKKASKLCYWLFVRWWIPLTKGQ